MSEVPDISLTAEPITDKDGRPSIAFRTKWQAVTRPQNFTVADLPDSARVGQWAYATDLRVFNGAGTRETAGNGTGGLVTWNGSNWVIVGTNVTAAA